jgi:hypothetical protein
MLQQAVGALEEWESCFWISTLSTTPAFPRLSVYTLPGARARIS